MPKFTRSPIAAVAAFAVVLFVGSGVVQAVDGDDDKGRNSYFIRMFDTNNDGKVTIDEITDDQARLFGAVDVNGDKALSVDEFRRRGRLFRTYSTTTLFDMLDTNGDQKLTLDEISGPSKRWFKRYDKNGDGAMVSEEFPYGKGYRGRYEHRGQH